MTTVANCAKVESFVRSQLLLVLGEETDAGWHEKEAIDEERISLSGGLDDATAHVLREEKVLEVQRHPDFSLDMLSLGKFLHCATASCVVIWRCLQPEVSSLESS